MRILAIVFVILLHVANGHATPTDSVVFAGRDAALVTALGDVLGPQRVITVDDAAPAAIGELTSASRILVERESAPAVIWLIREGGITTIVAYHRIADRVLVRTIPYAPPLDDAQAAITARSARAMLRALAVDEEVDRPAAPVDVPVPARPSDGQVLPQFATITALAARFGSPGSTGMPELTLGAIWRPRAFGAVVDLSMALAADLSAASFEGSIGDRSFGVAARWPAILSSSITVAFTAGGAVHALRFAGETPMRSIVDWRFDPAARVGSVVGYVLREGVEVGLSLSADYLLRRQRYEVEGNQILVMSPVQLAAGLYLTIGVL